MVLDSVDSTNAEALRRGAGLTRPCWILARQQTAGRGRRGREWTDPPGNFAATLALPSTEGPARLALRSFVAALALRDALVACTGLEAFALKWPNDVLLAGGKLSGILLESAPGLLIIGIGVNLRAHPPAAPDVAFPPTDLRSETGLTLSPDRLLAALAPAWQRWEGTFRAHGFAPVRAAFLAHAAIGPGQTVTARTLTDAITGVFDTIDDTGALILQTPAGRRAVPAADLYFGG